MRIAATTNYITRNFNYNPTFKSETSLGPDYHYDKKPFSQYDSLDEDEFLYTELPEDEDDAMIRYDEYPPSYSKNAGCMRSLGLAAIATAMITAGTMLITQSTNGNNDQDLVKSIQTEDIQKDTFTVKDINGDKVPDLILYKKDGSPIIVDFANRKN